MNYNTEFAKTGPCVIAYKGSVIGVSINCPLLNIEPGLYEAKRNQAVCKIIANLKITVSAEIRKIDSAFAGFPDADGKITDVVFGRDVLLTGGDLSFTPCRGNDNIRYCFPRAILIPETACAYKDMNEHCLKLEFEVYEDSEGVLIHKLS